MLELLNLFKKTQITGKNISLRNFKKQDIIQVAAWMRDLELIRLSFGITAQKSQLKQLSECLLTELQYKYDKVLTITDLKKNPIGLIKYAEKYPDASNSGKIINIGIFIGERKNRDKSLGTEAMLLAVEHFFKEETVDYIEVDTAVFNERALRCFLKCGFKIEKTFDETDYVTKIVMHKILLKLRREDFYPVYKAYFES